MSDPRIVVPYLLAGLRDDGTDAPWDALRSLLLSEGQVCLTTGWITGGDRLDAGGFRAVFREKGKVHDLDLSDDEMITRELFHHLGGGEPMPGSRRPSAVGAAWLARRDAPKFSARLATAWARLELCLGHHFTRYPAAGSWHVALTADLLAFYRHDRALSKHAPPTCFSTPRCNLHPADQADVEALSVPDETLVLPVFLHGWSGLSGHAKAGLSMSGALDGQLDVLAATIFERGRDGHLGALGAPVGPAHRSVPA